MKRLSMPRQKDSRRKTKQTHKKTSEELYCRRLSLSELAQAADAAADDSRSCRAELPGTASNNLLAPAALPDADGSALDRVAAAERASVLCVLRNLNLLDLLARGRAVARAVLADNTHLSRALGLWC